VHEQFSRERMGENFVRAVEGLLVASC